MNESNSLASRTHSASKISSAPTKQSIIAWIQRILTLQIQKLTIEQLGDGEILCCIVNHYVPGTILPFRIINKPRNQYESMINLKHLQNALTKLKINIPFDIYKIAKQKFHQNWNLISLLYRHLEMNDAFVSQNTSTIKIDKDVSHKISFSEVESVKDNQQKSEKNEKAEKAEKAEKYKGFILEENTNKFNQPQFFWEKIGQKQESDWIIDRTKQILLSSCHDTQKMRQLKKLLGVEMVKVQELQEDNWFIRQNSQLNQQLR